MEENMELKFNPRYPPPSEAVQEKIRMSFDEAKHTETRYVSCPVCGFKIAKISVTQTQLIYVKCRKCKFEGALSPAHFRSMKRYCSSQYYDFGEKSSWRGRR